MGGRDFTVISRRAPQIDMRIWCIWAVHELINGGNGQLKLFAEYSLENLKLQVELILRVSKTSESFIYIVELCWKLQKKADLVSKCDSRKFINIIELCES